MSSLVVTAVSLLIMLVPLLLASAIDPATASQHSSAASVRFSLPVAACCLAHQPQAQADDADAPLPTELWFEVEIRPNGLLPAAAAAASFPLVVNGLSPTLGWTGGSASGELDVPGIQGQEGHALRLAWHVACLDCSTDAAAANTELGRHPTSSDHTYIFTAAVRAIDGVLATDSRPRGFTLSYRQGDNPRVLQWSPDVTDMSDIGEEEDGGHGARFEEWFHPSQPASVEEVDASGAQETMNSASNGHEDAMLLMQNIAELRQLEAEAAVIQAMIQEKKDMIMRGSKKGRHRVCEDLRRCNGILCLVKTLAKHARQKCKQLLARLRPIGRLDGDMEPLLSHNGADDDGDHLDDGPSVNRTSARSYRYKPKHDNSTELSEKLLDIHLDADSNWLMTILEVMGSLLGICALSAFIRRRWRRMSGRVDMLTWREKRRLARQRRHAQRRARVGRFFSSFMPCMASRRRGPSTGPTDALPTSEHGAWPSYAETRGWRHRRQRPTDPGEKRALVESQESLLDAAMQEQVDGLLLRPNDSRRRSRHSLANLAYDSAEGDSASAMESEIRSLRRAHAMVDALVRAEEGHSPVLVRQPVRGAFSPPNQAGQRGQRTHPVRVQYNSPGQAQVPVAEAPGGGLTLQQLLLMERSARRNSNTGSLPSYHSRSRSRSGTGGSGDGSTGGAGDARSDGGRTAPPPYESDPDDDDDAAGAIFSGDVDVEVADGFRDYQPTRDYQIDTLSSGSSSPPLRLLSPLHPAHRQPAHRQPAHRQPAYRQPTYFQPAYRHPALVYTFPPLQSDGPRHRRAASDEESDDARPRPSTDSGRTIDLQI